MAMHRNTVVQLKSMAKERGLNGYSRLRKDDLIQFINDAGRSAATCVSYPLRPIPAPRTLVKPIPAPRTLVKPIPAPRTLVKPIPTPRISRIMTAINIYVKPTLIGIKKAFDWVPKQALNLNSYITKNLNDLIGWAKRPSQRKQLYELKESKSALRKFTMQYVIEGRAGLVGQIRGPIVQIVIQAPNLARMFFGDNWSNLPEGPLENPRWRPFFSRWPPFSI